MKTLEIVPLKHTKVTLKQSKRGQLKAFVDGLLVNRWHDFTFEISKEDAKELFKEMKQAYKQHRELCKIYAGTYEWFIQLQIGLQPVLIKRNGGKYLLVINTYRKNL